MIGVSWDCLPCNIYLQGPPLRCKWCPGTLLLNAKSLKTHIDSKRHQKRQKLSEDEPHPICLAEETEAGDTEVGAKRHSNAASCSCNHVAAVYLHVLCAKPIDLQLMS